MKSSGGAHLLSSCVSKYMDICVIIGSIEAKCQFAEVEKNIWSSTGRKDEIEITTKLRDGNFDDEGEEDFSGSRRSCLGMY